MSYILQALKRSENEQRAPQTPTITTEQHSDYMFVDDAPQRSLWLPVLAGAAFVSSVVLLGMWWMLGAGTIGTGHDPAQSKQPTPETSQPASVTRSIADEEMRIVGKREVTKALATPSWPPVSEVKVKAPVTADDTVLPATPAPAVELNLAQSEEAQVAATAPGSLDKDTQALRDRMSKQVLLARVQAAVAATQSMSGDGLDPLMPTNVKPLAEKSLALQKAVPTLSFSQHIYSSQADKRWVKVNGENHSEGQQIGGGVILERIEPQSVVLSLNGEYFSLPALAEW